MSDSESETNESSQSNSNDKEATISSTTPIVDNPYAVLNIAPNATNDEIQKSYKLLSRSFHPDKQPPGNNRDLAQLYFIKFKASYDILIDPVLRLAYDNHGMEGVVFVRKSVKIYKNIYDLLDKIDVNGNDAKQASVRNQAREILSEAMQYYNFHQNTRLRKPSTSANIKIKCNSTHSGFLGEGIENHLIEVEETSMSMSVTKSPDSKTSISFGGHGAVSNGQGSSGAQLSVNYEPAQGIDLNIDLNVGATPEQTKIAFGTSRVMSNQTYVASTLAASPGGDMPLGFTFTSHRSMMENKISGTWVMGLALPKFELQYGLLSFTANYPNQPKYTAKFNMGMNYTPVQLIAEKSFDEDHQHTGKLSWGWGARGIDLQAVTSRYLSKYCKISVGLHHVSSRGLTWLFQLQRGSIQFSVPILITTVMSPGYAVKSMYMSLFLGIMDASLGDLVRKEVHYATNKNSNLPESKALRREEFLLEREKVRRDALQQTRLMEKPAETKRLQEEKGNGLVILRAVYRVTGGDELDVTTALMFWVVKGRLHLPSTTKSSMLGFYNVRHETPVEIESGYVNACWKVWEKLWNGDEKKDSIVPVKVPTLTIRYRCQGRLYEITILDDDALSLPSPKAMELGGSSVK